MIVVTGAFGFIGSNIVNALNKHGKTDIIVVDDLSYGHKIKNLPTANVADYFDKDDFLEIEIEKSFTLTIGNIDNVKGTYGPSDINFSNSANKLKVSTTIFNNE